MKRTDHSSRRGYSLVEVMVGLVLLALVAILFTRLLVSQAKFFDKQSASNAARNVSRGPLNRVISDLRMVEAEGGVIAATTTAVTVRVPYAIGVLCETTASPAATEITLLPVDSVMYNAEGFYGYAWRDNATGHYTYIESGASVHPKNVVSACTDHQITNLTGGARVSLNPPLPAAATLGTPILLFRRIKYEFKASALVSGTVGLWRTVIFQDGSTRSEELAAPFANTAKFGFYTIDSQTAAANPPADLSTLRGFELHMDGMSEKVPAGKAVRQTTPFTTAVFFKNRVT